MRFHERGGRRAICCWFNPLVLRAAMDEAKYQILGDTETETFLKKIWAEFFLPTHERGKPLHCAARAFRTARRWAVASPTQCAQGGKTLGDRDLTQGGHRGFIAQFAQLGWVLSGPESLRENRQ